MSDQKSKDFVALAIVLAVINIALAVVIAGSGSTKESNTPGVEENTYFIDSTPIPEFDGNIPEIDESEWDETEPPEDEEPFFDETNPLEDEDKELKNRGLDGTFAESLARCGNPDQFALHINYNGYVYRKVTPSEAVNVTVQEVITDNLYDYIHNGEWFQ
jgi:hypothetical protein